MKNSNLKHLISNLFTFCLMLLLSISLLTGCKNQEQSSSDLVENEEQSATLPEEQSKKPSAILNTKEPLGEEGTLFYIPNEAVESGFLQNIAFFQDSILTYGYPKEMTEESVGTGDLQLKLISLTTGEVLEHTTYSKIEFPSVQVCGAYVAIHDWATGKIVLLDKNLQEVSQYQVDCEYNSMYLSSNVEKVYVFLPKGGVQITELASGKTEYVLEHAVNLYISQKCGDYITFSYVDINTQFEEYGALNLENGEITKFPFGGSYYYLNYVNDLWMATRFETREVNYIGNAETVQRFELPMSASIAMIYSNPGNLLATYYDENGLSRMEIFDVEGTFQSRCENALGEAFLQGELLWSDIDGGYFFLMTDPNEHDKLLFWDISVNVSGENLPFQTVTPEMLSESAVSAELYERAKAIGEKYGIEIRIAEQMEEDYNDYKVEVIFDESEISLALDAIERAFSQYPEGYFTQLLYGSIREIELHLAGVLTNLEIPEGEVNGFTSFAGFVQTRNDKAVIVVDAWQNGQLEEHLHHEIFHLTDDKLAFDAGIRENAVYSEDQWAALNPEEFEYSYNLFELPESYFEDDYGEWFIELYSRTYPREDRATIMEYAMLGMDAMFISAPYRQAKLEYLCECIRDAFDTTGWPEETRWEKTLRESY